MRYIERNICSFRCNDANDKCTLIQKLTILHHHGSLLFARPEILDRKKDKNRRACNLLGTFMVRSRGFDEQVGLLRVNQWSTSGNTYEKLNLLRNQVFGYDE